MRPGDPLVNRLTDILYTAFLGENGGQFPGAHSLHFGPEKAVCPHCGKTVKAVGLKQHMEAKHGN